MTKEKTLITTAIDYTNDVIHIGHAYEKILADCVARYKKINNKIVKLTVGTDEHGVTNERAAKERGIPTHKHVTEISKKDRKEIDLLNVDYDRFIRTTDKDHKKIASEFFLKSFENGDIYKGTYEGLYCEGCESYKTLSELDENKQCKLHSTRKIQKYKEENYFFRWSEYGDFLKKLVESDTFISPKRKRKEMLSFIKQGISDIPVTRPKYKLPWGITCPIDSEQVIYVWFDALINYFTFGSQNNLWDDNTEIIHFVGKDVARWHTLLWPAMLKSVGYRIPDTVHIHGFINLNGEKISKSKGNVIAPSTLVNKYGADVVRYYFLKYGPITEDVNVSIDHLEKVYNGELANGIGNTIARIAKLAEKSGCTFPQNGKATLDYKLLNPIENGFRTDLALQNIWKKISEIDKRININEPWKIEKKEKLKKVLAREVKEIREIAKLIEPFLPDTSKKIRDQFLKNRIKSSESLFPRL